MKRKAGRFRPAERKSADQEPWQRLRQLIRTGKAEDILPFLTTLAAGETARAMSRLSDANQTKLMALLQPGDAADVLETLPGVQAAELIEDMPPGQAASIVDTLPSARQADLLGELDEPEAEAILHELVPQRATRVRRLLQYPPDTAGGLMIPDFLAYPATFTVRDLLADVRAHVDRYTDFEIQYMYVTDQDRLVGVLRLRDLLLAPPERTLGEMMIADPLRVRDDTPVEQLKRFFDEHTFYGIPAVDADDHLLGVVRRAAVEKALRERATRTFLAISGLLGAEELRSMPIRARSFKRLSWLSLNIVLNIVAASVIAAHQDTLAAVITLAVFLPMISDMSGASGNQAVAVSIRELTLGLLRPYEYLRVIAKEGAVGLINGLVLGTVLGTLAVLWKGNIYLGVVVGGALALNVLIAVTIGGSIPLILRALKLDPALASGPILTTITDMCGFFMVLTFASMLLAKLVI